MGAAKESHERYDLGRLSPLPDDPRKIMLFIDAEVPQYDIAAGYFIIFEYLKIFLNNGYKILFWPFNRLKIEPYTGELEQLGIDVIYGDVSFGDLMEKCGRYLDIAVVCRPEIASSYLDLIRQSSKCGIMYFAHDLHYLRLDRLAQVSGSEEEAGRALQTKEEELGAMLKADISLFLSDREVEIVAEEGLDIKAAAIPWIQELNTGATPPFDERRGLVYLGGFLHSPNVDAVHWLYRSIFPLLQDRIPGVEVSIVGSNMPDEIRELDGDSFRIVGFVEKLDDYLNQARAFIAPLRYGAGIKGKIIMAQSYGLPVVTTGIGAEGMGLRDQQTALIAQEPEEFAEKTALLYQNRELWDRISTNSIRHVAENYSAGAAEKIIMKIIDDIGGRSRVKSFIKRFRERCRQANKWK